MIIRDTINVPKIIFPLVSDENHLRKILNVNQWDKFNGSLLFKLKLATEIFFNRYIYYHLKDFSCNGEFEIFNIACIYGNMEILQLMIEKIEKIENELSTLPPNWEDEIANSWKIGLISACWKGHLSIIQLMINKGANNWNNGLSNACLGGHLSIVQLMIDKGANEWNWGLIEACEGGHLSIIQLMIEKGANNWNSGLNYACRNGHLLIVQLMIEKIESELSILPPDSQDEKRSNYLNNALRTSNYRKHLEVINYLSKLLKIEE